MPPRISLSDDEQSDISAVSDSDEVSDLDDLDLDEEDDGANEYDDFEDALTPDSSRKGSRETRKRQLSFYEEDDSDAESQRQVSVKLKIPRRAAGQSEDKPDTLKMTERQRARLEETSVKFEDTFQEMDEQLLSLNKKTQKKKETEEQIALRKAENARRRAHYKTKQLEEEKRDTLNKLLKRRANKTRENVDEDPDLKSLLRPRRPLMQHPALVRWVCKPEILVLGTNI